MSALDSTPGRLAQAVEHPQLGMPSTGLHEIQQQQVSHTNCCLQQCTYISSCVGVMFKECLQRIQRFVTQIKPQAAVNSEPKTDMCRGSQPAVMTRLLRMTAVAL